MYWIAATDADGLPVTRTQQNPVSGYKLVIDRTLP
jgi:hypothetical protein